MRELIEKIRKNKNLIILILSAVLFILSLSYLGSVYISVNKRNHVEEMKIEVSLPVINWQKYSNLSKRYPNDIINNR